LAIEYAGDIKLVKVNVDDAPRTSGLFSIQGIPALIITRNGSVIARRSGAAPEAELRSWLQAAIADSPNHRSRDTPNTS
jgi:thioredoxin 2